MFRVPTCEVLTKTLESQSPVVLIRGPPYSGKTSLAKLYEHHLSENGENVVFLSLLGLLSLLEFDAYWKKRTSKLFLEWNECCDRLFIVIDEAQIIYQLGHENFFWRSVKERLQKTNGPFFVLFSAYGEHPVNTSQGNVFATPIAIPCVLDLSLLLLGKEEYDELIQGYNNTNQGRKLPFGTGLMRSSNVSDLVI